MEHFRLILQQEYLKRVSKNRHYSLRAFAQHLNVNHAILSLVLSGKRKITKAMVIKFSSALGMSPEEVKNFSEESITEKQREYFLLQNDAFSVISEWYFDAILEMCRIPRMNLNPQLVGEFLDIPVLQATHALETLERIGLLKKNINEQYELTFQNTTNILDPNTTTSAKRKYQGSVIGKSIDALENVDPKSRDHTSTTMAISTKDLPAAKELIRKFRHELNAYMQRCDETLDDVYQLQVSFFPLTNQSTLRSIYEN